MRQHDANGREIAKWLVEQVGDENVFYIGLPTHPQHELVRRQMTGFGGMISVELGTRERAAHVLGRVRVFALAESLGGVESLISQPAGMTHASVPPERRAAMGLSDGLIRLSCGVEDVGDLLADLEQAFEGIPEREAGSGQREAGRETQSGAPLRRDVRRSQFRAFASPFSASHFPLPASRHGSRSADPDLVALVGASRRSRGAEHPPRHSRVRRSRAQGRRRSSASAAFASSSSATR